MKIARSIILILLIATLSILLFGCQSDTASQTTTGEAVFKLNADILGKMQSVSLDGEGKSVATVSVTSPDETIILSIAKGTKLLDTAKKPLQNIRLIAIDSLPLSPANTQIIGAVYELSPEKSTANPPLIITLSFDPQDLPKGVSENNIYIAPYDEATGWGKWTYKNVNTANKRVTTQVSSFGIFAVLVPLPPVSSPSPVTPSQSSISITLQEALSNGKPTLAEFGSNTCIPCKQMKPILENLAVEYEGKLNVVIVEVYEQMELTRQYRIQAIPTQIVFDSTGKEVTRHMGLWPKEQITAQLNKMGIK